MLDRERVGREASPSAAVIDIQSVKTTESGGPRGFDAGEKVKGRKRHALVDTDGRALLLEVHPASILGPRRRRAAASCLSRPVSLHRARLRRHRFRCRTRSQRMFPPIKSHFYVVYDCGSMG